MYKIYISSTYKDLAALRNVAKDVILNLHHHPVAMENYNSTSEKPLDKCLRDVSECEIFVGIYAFRYGFIPSGYEKSITHLEYEEAFKREKTRLLFVFDDDTPIPPKFIDENRSNIIELRRKICNDNTVTILNDFNKFAEKLSASIHDVKPITDRIPSRPIPPILPYLSNRSIQSAELELKLDECEDCLNSKPLVAFIHGDELECHDKFIKRLHEITLPKMLRGQSNVSVDLTRVEWPSVDLNLTSRYKKMTCDIAKAITDNRNAQVNEIKKELDRRNAAQMIYFVLPVAAWKEKECELITMWLKYWDEFPELNQGKKLLIFLCIKYKNISSKSSDESGKYSKYNKEAKDFIQKLAIKSYTHISGLLMTELHSVEYAEIDNWIEAYVPESCDDTKLREMVMDFYNARNNKAVPMLELAGKLNEILFLTQYKEGITK
jgi:hypothetical protein